MDRLTIKTPTGAALKLNSPSSAEEAHNQLIEAYKVAINKLAAYEDTSLSPEQVAGFAQAEKNGRMIMIPDLNSSFAYMIRDLNCESAGCPKFSSCDNECPKIVAEIDLRKCPIDEVIGFKLYSTRAEAVKALSEMEGEMR